MSTSTRSKTKYTQESPVVQQFIRWLRAYPPVFFGFDRLDTSVENKYVEILLNELNDPAQVKVSPDVKVLRTKNLVLSENKALEQQEGNPPRQIIELEQRLKEQTAQLGVIKQLEADAGKLRRNFELLQMERDTFEQSANALAQQIRALENSGKGERAELEKLRQELRLTKEELDNIKAELIQVRTQAIANEEELGKQLRASNNANKQLEIERQQLIDQLNAIESQLRQSNQANEQQRRALEQQYLDKMNAMANSYDAELRQNRELLANLERDVESLRTQLTEARRRQTELEVELQREREDHANAQAILGEQQRQQQAELEALKTQPPVIDPTTAAELSATKAELDALKQQPPKIERVEVKVPVPVVDPATAAELNATKAELDALKQQPPKVERVEVKVPVPVPVVDPATTTELEAVKRDNRNLKSKVDYYQQMAERARFDIAKAQLAQQHRKMPRFYQIRY